MQRRRSSKKATSGEEQQVSEEVEESPTVRWSANTKNTSADVHAGQRPTLTTASTQHRTYAPLPRQTTQHTDLDWLVGCRIRICAHIPENW
jgi:hypothetical protein